ncbi:S24 family peptidase [Altererythrobacter sp. ZODW24]|uniref:S24 family peptidase n=1 Tax=Altererythrobacter sp. ZODW24 TaxID=2185142 RepID=UPI000DF778C6|nr:S24 family peptidase [Altererythrobacter sp. ZODW24]
MKKSQEIADSDPRERLLVLSQERGVSLSGLSDLIGRNASYLQQFIRKGSPRKLEEQDRRTLAQFFGVEEGELGAPDDVGEGGAARTRRAGYAAIPRLPLGASAGPGASSDNEQPYDTLGFSQRWLREQGLDPAMLSAIEVKGDSMEPLLRDGDEILVDTTPRALRDGIHVVRLGDTLLVKRVQAVGAERLSLISQNEAYAAIEVDASEAEIVGRVVWKGGRL